MGGTELEVLKAVRKKGGEASVSAIAAQIKMSSDYARIVCRGLGMSDYVDVFRNGRVRLTEKGMAALRKAAPEPAVPPEASEGADAGKPGHGGSQDADSRSDDQKPLSPQEKYRLWTTGSAEPPQADARAVAGAIGDGGRVVP